MKRTSRNPWNFSQSMLHQLNSYTLAASAAGVSLLALAQPADAEIVYTPAHKAIGRNGKFALDLNHDGKTDFNFQETFITTTSVYEAHSLILSVLPGHKGNAILGMNQHASALQAGVRVGGNRRFSYARQTMAVDIYQDGTGGSGTCGGPWNNVKNRYLGLKFSVGGKIHYGWARLNATCTTKFVDHKVTGLLTGYAYETIPNKPIVTGKTKGPNESAHPPAGLGQLARGVSAP